jgi:tRNA A37 threonylcarbamoyladenosine synthetase subunit TsaC/SUA5/YrdC
VAIRVPAAPIPVAIVSLSGLPITATSANLSGAAECTTADAVRMQLQDRLTVIIDGGPSPRDIPSTIVDLSGDFGIPWTVQREGAIPAHEIANLLGGEIESAS